MSESGLKIQIEIGIAIGIARGSALAEAKSENCKTELDRMAAMLSRLGGRGYQVREGSLTCGQGEARIDTDPDSDSDLDEGKPKPPAGGDEKFPSDP